MNKTYRTHCPKGHELVGDNLIETINKNGAHLRNCRICRNSWEPKLRTHCFHGHELTPDNVYEYISKQNHLIRECKICAKDKYNRRFLQLRDNHLQRKFKIGIKEYDEMLIQQGGKCFICGSEKAGGNGARNGKNNFHVDHDHTTGIVRKLLCTHCNNALGYARDNPENLRKMADYIESHKEL